MGPEEPGAGVLGPDTLGPDTLGPDTLGPDTLGPDTLGPDTLGPDTLGAVARDPGAPGPDVPVDTGALGACRSGAIGSGGPTGRLETPPRPAPALTAPLSEPPDPSLNSLSFGSFSSIRAISRQAPGRANP